MYDLCTVLLESGSNINGYHIVGFIGAGGMGRVYRARDTRLSRDVALKLLPDEFSSDAERLARFEREARAVAALNHSNIGAIHSIERAPGDVPFLVLEYVAGETLRGAIPLAEAIAIARQICDGLEVAHQRGIIHRDLKPANIKLTPDGRVKILDFGLAKNLASTSTEAEGLGAPTVSIDATKVGVVLGTAAYMSPEQARGRPVDNRTDVWSFGCVLYELLVGRPPFRGDSVQDTLSQVLTREPDWQALAAATPTNIRRLLRRCLQKDPHNRLRHIGDARLELEETGESGPFQERIRPPKSSVVFAWITAAVMACIALAFWVYRVPPDVGDQRVATLSLIPPDKYTFGSITVSPDGQTLAFTTVNADGESQLWVRPLDSVSAQPLVGTEGATQPFWAPDSRALGFFANGKLKRVNVGGGPPQTVCEAAGNYSGGAWNADGVIVFAPGASNPLHRVSATGGTPQAVTQKDGARREEGHAWPHFLPDGRRFLYASRVWGTGQGNYTVYAGSLDGGAPKQLLTTASHPIYVAAHGGHLLFMREGLLLAQPFDAAELETTGEPTVLGKVGFNFSAVGAGGGVWSFSASTNGVLVFQSGNTGFTQMVWFDRTGKRLGTVDQPDFRYNLSISPDGNRVSSERLDPSGNYDIWITDLSRGTSSRLTTNPAPDGNPVWSPDASRLVFFSVRTGVVQIYQTASGGSANAETLLLKSERLQTPTDWSRDGRFLMYSEEHPATRMDIWLHRFTGGLPAVPVVRTNFNEDHGRLSPDGKWIAYQSDESGRNEVYLQRAPQTDSVTQSGDAGRLQVSTQGGREPRWRRDGRELYYLSPDGNMMAVDVRPGPLTVNISIPQPLFAVRAIGRSRYDVTGDGPRFLVNVPAQVSALNPATVVLNWTNGLKTVSGH